MRRDLISTEPLRRYFRRHGGETIVTEGRPKSELSDEESRDLARLKRAQETDKMSVWKADELCIRRLGVHPEVLWGQEFFDPSAGSDDSNHHEGGRRRPVLVREPAIPRVRGDILDVDPPTTYAREEDHE